MVYKWKTGYYSADPETAANEFKRLEETVGLTSANLVEASRPEEAPLHNEFEWRDDVAAEKYRKHQAAVMIAALEIVTNTKKGETRTRAFVTLSPKMKEGNFERIENVMEVREKRDALLELAKRDLITFKSKYKGLLELSGVFSAIDLFIESEE